jgi:hypothetical protein
MDQHHDSSYMTIMSKFNDKEELMNYIKLFDLTENYQGKYFTKEFSFFRYL